MDPFFYLLIGALASGFIIYAFNNPASGPFSSNDSLYLYYQKSRKLQVFQATDHGLKHIKTIKGVEAGIMAHDLKEQGAPILLQD